MICPHCGRETVVKKENDVRIRVFIDNFHALYFAKFGYKPHISGKDAVVVKRMLKQNDLQFLVKSIESYFSTDYLFFKTNAYDISRYEKYILSLKTGATYGPNATSSGGKRGRNFTQERADFRKQRNEKLLHRGNNATRGVDAANSGPGGCGVLDSTADEVFEASVTDAQ